MWVSYERDNVWVFFAGSVGLILFLYCVKAFVLRWVRGAILASIAFAIVAAVCVPITWALSPDWNNINVNPMANYAGNPIATLFIPCASFMIDLARAISREKWLVLANPARVVHSRAGVGLFLVVYGNVRTRLDMDIDYLRLATTRLRVGVPGIRTEVA